MSRRLLVFGGIAILLLVILGTGVLVQRAREEALRTSAEVATAREALRSAELARRYTAAAKITKLGSAAGAAAPELKAALIAAVKKLADEDAINETNLNRNVVPLARALWAIGEPAESTLASLLDDKNDVIRLGTVMATTGLNQVFTAGDASRRAVVVGVLRKGLRDPSPRVRFYSCGGLGELGPAAKELVPTLLDLKANDSDEKVRNMANIAAGSLQAKP